MSIQEKFSAAQVQVKTLSKTPDNHTLLQLYALYKQGSMGDVQGKRPGMLDMKGRAKYDAWGKEKGVPQDSAMEKYVALVERLVG
ncbi:MAG: acyl-CoA-binding protein [Deltaproteobacteria bacterium]|nr:acyl-CoA-binding protein [Deltaproteobacteria bacterium]